MGKENQPKTFGDTVGAHAFPDATETPLSDVLDTPLLVRDVAFKTMQYGEVAILLADTVDGEKMNISVLVGGEVVRAKCRDAQAQGLLPLVGTISMSPDKRYYDIA